MARLSGRFLRRGTLTPKRGNKDYYKGYGARTEGTHTTKGAFVIRPERLMNIQVPQGLATFQLKPYVHTKAMKPPKGSRVPEWSAEGSAVTAEKPLR